MKNLRVRSNSLHSAIILHSFKSATQLDKPTWLDNVQTGEAISLVLGFWQRANYLKMSTAHFKIPVHEMLYSISGMKKSVKRKVADDINCT